MNVVDRMIEIALSDRMASECALAALQAVDLKAALDSRDCPPVYSEEWYGRIIRASVDEHGRPSLTIYRSSDLVDRLERAKRLMAKDAALNFVDAWLAACLAFAGD